MSLTARQVAAVLGVSERMVYALAAPAGPLPCYRLGRAVRFDAADVEEYRTQCRSTRMPALAVGGLSSTAVSVGSESALLRFFRQRGIKPKLTHSTGQSPRASTPKPPGHSHPE